MKVSNFVLAFRPVVAKNARVRRVRGDKKVTRRIASKAGEGVATLSRGWPVSTRGKSKLTTTLKR